tara:strand:- start:4738 stop:4929 length:192 start_codon:yes stop_codon:yes gene_type:complete
MQYEPRTIYQRSFFMKQYPSSEDMLTINVLQKELTIPSLSPIYREELEKRISQIEKPPPNPFE